MSELTDDMIGAGVISLNSDRRRFVTMWRYYFDDSFQRAKAYTKPQEISRILKFVNKICLKIHLQNVGNALSQKRRDYRKFFPV